MLKFLLIIALISYLIYRVGGFLFKILFLGAQQQRQQYQSTGQTHQQHARRRAAGSNLDIDYVPGDRKNEKKDFRGGDYVDYEEVK
ncbi:DUF4834 family protein [Marinoscillum sp. 108]|uniref:DUF4834 family protein n=1 Tax=Marinoscillum luteum TaxID=861051 RepID=A0ABW7NBE4_9BACT|nr:DUF4834 family protein [Marinoscillum sp. 108]VXD19742.1 conserved hypothetical protein [Marinoscillum sp. 108]